MLPIAVGTRIYLPADDKWRIKWERLPQQVKDQRQNHQRMPRKMGKWGQLPIPARVPRSRVPICQLCKKRPAVMLKRVALWTRIIQRSVCKPCSGIKQEVVNYDLNKELRRRR